MALLLLSRMSAQLGSAPIEFEVAIIHPASTARITSGASSSTRITNDRFEVRGFTLKALIKMAYRIEDYQILGGPKWFDSDPYDIDAKSPHGGTPQQIPQRLQSLLIDRFRLLLHHEARNLPAYALATTKDGPKIKRSEAGAQTGFGWGPSMIRSQGASMRDFAERLAEALHHPVFDQTGLGGLFAIDLKFAPVDPDPSDNISAPSIFEALQEQLGLKLSATKGQVDVIVIDGAEKPASN